MVPRGKREIRRWCLGERERNQAVVPRGKREIRRWCLGERERSQAVVPRGKRESRRWCLRERERKQTSRFFILPRLNMFVMTLVVPRDVAARLSRFVMCFGATLRLYRKLFDKAILISAPQGWERS
jgi:hypothetical protein